MIVYDPAAAGDGAVVHQVVSPDVVGARRERRSCGGLEVDAHTVIRPGQARRSVHGEPDLRDVHARTDLCGEVDVLAHVVGRRA